LKNITLTAAFLQLKKRGKVLINIVSVAQEHLERVLEIEQGAISPPWSSEALLDEMSRDDSYFVVAVNQAGEPSPCLVGFAFLRQVGDDGELLHIAVDTTSRGCGVGDALMSAVFKHATENALKSVFLEVRSSNNTAIRLYEKHGFSTVRIRKDYYDKPVEDALIMSKKL